MTMWKVQSNSLERTAPVVCGSPVHNLPTRCIRAFKLPSPSERSSTETASVLKLYANFKPGIYASWQLKAKRAIDISLASFLLILCSPLMLLTDIVIKLTSKGPVIFAQKRCGFLGHTFTMYKFRSMSDGAERMQEALLSRNEMHGPVFKMKNDPRVTWIGNFLRRSSIDELPQLLNVLKGEMSLVGPRPPLPNEVAQYAPWQRMRLLVKPGITCIWQVSGRSNADFDTWMEMDLYYIWNWSLWLDIRLLLKTVPAVLLGTGAR